MNREVLELGSLSNIVTGNETYKSLPMAIICGTESVGEATVNNYNADGYGIKTEQLPGCTVITRSATFQATFWAWNLHSFHGTEKKKSWFTKQTWRGLLKTRRSPYVDTSGKPGPAEQKKK